MPDLTRAALANDVSRTSDMDYPHYLRDGLYGGREGMTLADAERMAAEHRRAAADALAAHDGIAVTTRLHDDIMGLFGLGRAV